jgi:hypothetical protein
MIEVASAINSFAFVAQQTNFETIEIPISEYQNVLRDLTETHNQIAEMVKNAGILRGRELARLTAKAIDSLKVASSPCEKILLLNAHLRQLLSKIRDALKAKPQKQVVRQAITKIQIRAMAIVDHMKSLADGKERISLSSPQARAYLAGMEGKPVSRRDCIRALKRAEKIYPILTCAHTPNDGRQTTRLTAIVQGLLNVSFGNDHPRAYT